VVLKGLDGPSDVHVEVTDAEPLRMATQIGRGRLSYTTTMRCTPAGRGYDFAWDQDTEWPAGLPGAFGDEASVGRWMEQMLRQSADNAGLLIEAMVPQPV
jgi:Polyketide cyclase / dehydrase and lipid transport